MSTSRPYPSAAARMGRFVQALIWKAAFGLLVLAAAAAGYLYFRGSQELRGHIERTLAARFPHLNVQVGSVRLLPGEGIRIRHLALIVPDPRAASRREHELALVDEVLVDCAATLEELLRGDLRMEGITVRGMHVRTTRASDGTWDLTMLLPERDPDHPLPRLKLEGGTLEVIDQTGTSPRILQLTGVHLVASSQRLEEATAEAPAGSLLVNVSGTFHSPHIGQGSFDARIHPDQKQWQVEGKLTELLLTEHLQETLPISLPRLPKWDAAHARLRMNFFVGSAGPAADLAFSAAGTILDGQWKLPGLNASLDNVRGTFRLDNSGWQLHQVEARFGAARLVFSCGSDGWSNKSPFWLTGEAQDFVCTPALIGQCPQPVQDLWQKHQLTGRMDVDLNLEFDGHRWIPVATCRLKEAALVFQKFPYPVQQAQGELHYRSDRLDIAMVGTAGSTPVELTGHIDRPGEEATGTVTVRSQGWMPIDDVLLRAMPPAGRRILESLDARGQIQFRAQLECGEPGQPPSLHMDAEVQNGWVNYHRFPYPLQSVTGRLEVDDGQWRLVDFRGRNGSCEVHCDGWFRPKPDGRTELHFRASEVPLESSLHDALQVLAPTAAGLWTGFAPQGTVDQLQVDCWWQRGWTRPWMEVELWERDDEAPESTPLVLRPRWLPYSWEQVTGRWKLSGRTWQLEQLRGRHGNTTIQLDASGSYDELGRWTAQIDNLAAYNLRVEQALCAAVPESLQPYLREIDSQGLFAVTGSAQVTGDPRWEAPQWSWDLTVDMDQVNIGGAQGLHHIFGQVQVVGASQGESFNLQGDLSVDSMIHRQIQLSQVQGRLRATPQQLLLGRWAEQGDSPQPARPLRATLFEGHLEVDGRIGLGDHDPFELHCTLQDADLSVLARDLGTAQSAVSGRAHAALRLRGTQEGAHTLIGAGQFRLRDANLYELPQIISLFKLLSVRTPDRTAFTTSDAQFRIQGNRIYFDQLDLSGDAISLKGMGEMDFQQRINLQFYTIMGREQLWGPILPLLLGEASRQFLLIHVDGTVQRPQMTREVLPGLNDTLRQLFPEQAYSMGWDSPTSPPASFGAGRIR